ncbi:C40 family peptidase [Rugosimonospora africana]|uniref:Hydrolase Nlp/P60 n=1 Tax=Rugosimonospora africana TaxID=556532 RepID=A0A8J3QXS4_9ACTN|nr:C40 family peptidase [Rugosimonospora africana]GIH18062.1 hydrolase Nlp/P60 [Rugosimonospora africana]
MASARVLTRPRRVAIALAAVLVAVVGTGTNAEATPSISDIEGQINESWNKLEPLVEQYNELHSQLLQNQGKVATLKRQIEPLQVQVDLTMTRVSALSTQLYEHGATSPLDALLNSGTPATMADQLSTLDAMAHRQSDTIQGAADLLAKYNAQKQPLDRLVATESVQDASLAHEKTTIQKQMDNLQVLRRQAYGASGKAGGSLQPVACPAELTTGKGAIAAKTACQQIGKSYIWATAGPRTFDCSGLTLYAWGKAGVTLGHFTGWQWSETKSVSRSQLQPGDLVFYFSDHHHMGMYVGDGWVVHAPTTGDVVRMTQLSNPYLPIAGFRRPG